MSLDRRVEFPQRSSNVARRPRSRYPPCSWRRFDGVLRIQSIRDAQPQQETDRVDFRDNSTGTGRLESCGEPISRAQSLRRCRPADRSTKADTCKSPDLSPDAAGHSAVGAPGGPGTHWIETGNGWIELNLEISCFREPDNLFVETNHDNFGQYAYQNKFFRHRCAFLGCPAKIAQRAAEALAECRGSSRNTGKCRKSGEFGSPFSSWGRMRRISRCWLRHNHFGGCTETGNWRKVR